MLKINIQTISRNQYTYFEEYIGVVIMIFPHYASLFHYSMLFTKTRNFRGKIDAFL